MLHDAPFALPTSAYSTGRTHTRKSQRYSAVIGRKDGGLLLKDPALGGEVVLSSAALADEMTGYVLVPAPARLTGRVVPVTEGNTVVGHCHPPPGAMTKRFVATPADVPVPSVLHLKSQHYSAVIGRQDGGLLVKDPALGGEVVLSAAALADEMTGYVLVPAAARPVGRVVPAATGRAGARRRATRWGGRSRSAGASAAIWTR